jgi:hypothetical protein
VLNGESTNINLIVFGLTWSGLEPKIYRTRGENVNHYTIDAVRNGFTRGRLPQRKFVDRYTSINNKMNCELMLTYDTPALRQTGSRNLTGQKTLPMIWGTYMKLVTKYQISAINSCWEKCAYMFNVYKNQLSRQTGSRNLTGPKSLPTIWGTYMKLVTKYQISAINSCWEKCAYMFNVYKNQLCRQTGSRNLTGLKTLPTIWHTYMKLVTKYQIPVINSCLEKCDEKCAYTNVCSMCIKINKIGKQEVGIWWVQKRFPRYGVPIWSLWPNIRFLPSIIA